MILEARTEPEGFSILAENPSPLAEDPSPQKLCSRLFGRDPAADTVPSWPSSLAVPAVRRPWPPQPSVALGSPGCPGPPQPTTPPNGLVNHSCVPAVHPAWRLRQPQLLPGRPPRLTASPTTAAPRPSIPPNGLANHSCAPAVHPA